MDDQNRNLILATALSFLVILVWFILFPPPEPEPVPSDVAQQVQPEGALIPPAGDTAATPTDLTAPAISNRDAAIGQTERIRIETARLSGSISLVGGRIDDLLLKDYRVTLDPDSPLVTLLSPSGAPEAYYALYGWAPAGGLGFDAVPGPATPWRSRAARC
jgi:YidC/Oxa1 family membrane protein insertase